MYFKQPNLLFSKHHGSRVIFWYYRHWAFEHFNFNLEYDFFTQGRPESIKPLMPPFFSYIIPLLFVKSWKITVKIVEMTKNTRIKCFDVYINLNSTLDYKPGALSLKCDNPMNHISSLKLSKRPEASNNPSPADLVPMWRQTVAAPCGERTGLQ